MPYYETEGKLVFESGDVDLDKVQEAARLLREAGVSFDSGAGILPTSEADGATGVEWHLDNIEGATLYEYLPDADEAAGKP